MRISVPRGLDRILGEFKLVDDEELPRLASFMGRCLTLDPASRPTAQELLKDPWLPVDGN